MFNFTNKNAGNTTRWLILGALGVLLIINRRFALNIAYIVFAIGLMLAGAASAFGWWERRSLLTYGEKILRVLKDAQSDALKVEFVD